VTKSEAIKKYIDLWQLASWQFLVRFLTALKALPLLDEHQENSFAHRRNYYLDWCTLNG
jgi:hypothetical protein